MTLRSAAIAIAALLSLALVACKGGRVPDGEGGDNGGPRGEGGACGTCASVFVNGGIVCGPGASSDAFDALSFCACADTCASACGGNLCVNTPADEMCGECVTANCADEQKTCAEN
jgi:hypothetical protein